MRLSFTQRAALAHLLYTCSAIANSAPSLPAAGHLDLFPKRCDGNCSTGSTVLSTRDPLGDTTVGGPSSTPVSSDPVDGGTSMQDGKPTATRTSSMPFAHTETPASPDPFTWSTTYNPTITPSAHTESTVDPNTLTIPATAHTEISVDPTTFTTPTPLPSPHTESSVIPSSAGAPHVETSVDPKTTVSRNPPGAPDPGNPISSPPEQLPATTPGGPSPPKLTPDPGHLPNPGDSQSGGQSSNNPPDPKSTGDAIPAVTGTVPEQIPPVVVLLPSAPVQVLLPINPSSTITVGPEALPTVGGTTVIGTGSTATTFSVTTNSAGQTVVVVGGVATQSQTLTLTTVTTLPIASKTRANSVSGTGTGTGLQTVTKSGSGLVATGSATSTGAAVGLLSGRIREVWKVGVVLLVMGVQH